MYEFNRKYGHLSYFIIAIISLITFMFIDDIMWLVLFFGWLSMGFISIARRKNDRELNEQE